MPNICTDTHCSSLFQSQSIACLANSTITASFLIQSLPENAVEVGSGDEPSDKLVFVQADFGLQDTIYSLAIHVELLLRTILDLENSDDTRHLSLASSDHSVYHSRVRVVAELSYFPLTYTDFLELLFGLLLCTAMHLALLTNTGFLLCGMVLNSVGTWKMLNKMQVCPWYLDH